MTLKIIGLLRDFSPKKSFFNSLLIVTILPVGFHPIAPAFFRLNLKL